MTDDSFVQYLAILGIVAQSLAFGSSFMLLFQLQHCDSDVRNGTAAVDLCFVD